MSLSSGISCRLPGKIFQTRMINKGNIKPNWINLLCQASSCNTAFTQELVFSDLKHFSNQESCILAEGTLLPFPLLRKCRERCTKTPRKPGNDCAESTSLSNLCRYFSYDLLCVESQNMIVAPKTLSPSFVRFSYHFLCAEIQIREFAANE